MPQWHHGLSWWEQGANTNVQEGLKKRKRAPVRRKFQAGLRCLFLCFVWRGPWCVVLRKWAAWLLWHAGGWITAADGRAAPVGAHRVVPMFRVGWPFPPPLFLSNSVTHKGPRKWRWMYGQRSMPRRGPQLELSISEHSLMLSHAAAAALLSHMGLAPLPPLSRSAPKCGARCPDYLETSVGWQCCACVTLNWSLHSQESSSFAS